VSSRRSSPGSHRARRRGGRGVRGARGFYYATAPACADATAGAGRASLRGRLPPRGISEGRGARRA
jgi:hypothetical protein